MLNFSSRRKINFIHECNLRSISRVLPLQCTSCRLNLLAFHDPFNDLSLISYIVMKTARGKWKLGFSSPSKIASLNQKR